VEECDRLLDMINTMLIISKAEAGVSILHRETMDLDAVLSAACDLFGTIADDRQIVLFFNSPGRCPFHGDVRMIQRMISNLIDNAVKYSPPGGRIDIDLAGCSSENENIIVTVADTGIGIPLQEQDKIFERFYRCDPSRSHAGTGLGLSLARTIARSHGGDITVFSRPGEGSTFTVTFPLNAKV